MRRYILKDTSLTIEKTDWSKQRYSERKAFDVLTGLALGILSDGELTQPEALFLAKWVEANSQNLPEHFIRKLLPVIRLAGRGNKLSESELKEIATILEEIAFSGSSQAPANAPPTIGTPCALIFDEIVPSDLTFDGVEFVFTGNFLCGSKKDLMERTSELGASAKSANPTRQTDYVVVGSKGSEQWAYSGLGRKVEHALKLKSESCKLRIIREEIFIQALDSIDSSSTDH